MSSRKILAALFVLSLLISVSAMAQAATATPPAKSGAKAATGAQTPPQPGMVWANQTSKIYHKEGDRWYGKSKNGKWMTEADAKKAGFKAAKPSAVNAAASKKSQ